MGEMRAVERLMTALRRGQSPAPRPRATWRDDMVAAAFAAWMVFGLFIDGWAHINLRQGRLGPFFTPWHGILYAGFTALALWIVSRNQERGSFNIDRVPIGYGIAYIGMAVTAFAVGGDAIWHTIFGEEVDVARLLAPFHLVLFSGAIVLAAGPFRSLWMRDDGNETPTAREFLPALLSITLATSVVLFFMQFVSPFIHWLPEQVLQLVEASPFSEGEQILGLSQLLVTSLIIVAPVLLILRRWKPPFGAITLLMGSAVGMISALNEFSLGGLVLAAVVGGLATDIAIHRVWQPTPARRRAALRVASLVLPFTLWGSYFIFMKMIYGVDGTMWPVEIWGGAIFIATIGGWVLSLLMVPNGAPMFAEGMTVVAPVATALAAPVAAEQSISLMPFLQELADLVAAAEAAAMYGEAARQARDAARVLRAAAEKLPGNLKPRFPMETELARLEALAEASGPPSPHYLEGLRDAAGILAGAKRGLPVDEGVRMVLLNLTARAERTLVASDERARVLVDAVTDTAGHRALVDATLRHLAADPEHHVVDLSLEPEVDIDLTDGALAEHTGDLDLVGDIFGTT